MDDEYSFTDEYKVRDIIHYLRVIPNLGINEIIECKLRTVKSNYIVGVGCNSSKQVIMMNKSAIKFIFKDRKLAAKESKNYHVRKVTKEVEIEED